MLVMFSGGEGMTKAGRIVLYSACGQRESLPLGLLIYHHQGRKKFTFKIFPQLNISICSLVQ